MNKQYISGIVTGVLMMVSVLFGMMLANIDLSMFAQQPTPTAPSSATPALAPSETFPPSSPLPSLTPSQTLKPPPTFEPPTATPRPSDVPSATPTSTLQINVPPPDGLQGLVSPTDATTTSGVCEKREDWTLRYTVQSGDALANIADLYGTLVSELVMGNCLDNANTIYAGQILRVPGDAPPAVPEYVCTGWEALTPFDGAYAIDPDSNLTFNWRGPTAERYLLRINRPDGSTYEELIDMKQNVQVFLPEAVPAAGNYTWYVVPLTLDFVQIPCSQGGPWYFNKEQSIALTWTPSPTFTSTPTPEPWVETATAAAR
jgi:LysM repeat protein